MRHDFTYQGLSSFFQCLANSHMADALDQFERNQTVCQQLQRSAILSLRRIAAGQGNEMGLYSFRYLRGRST